MNILVQLFWICLVVLESDYEHEFLLGLRLLEKVLSKLPLDRPDVREKIEKLQVQCNSRLELFYSTYGQLRITEPIRGYYFVQFFFSLN